MAVSEPTTELVEANPPELHIALAGDGVPVVFTHGWLNTGDVWNGAIEALDGAVRSATWDMRGHGRSGAAAPGDYTRAHALADLDRVLDAVGRPAILVGHSLGGYLSLAQAILKPDDVAALVLVGAGPGFRSDDSREKWNDMVRDMATKSDIPEGMEQISMHTDAMVMDRMTEITVPAYTVVGAKDKGFIASANVFDKNLNVVKRHEVPDMGHMVHVKAPAAVAEAVRVMAADL